MNKLNKKPAIHIIIYSPFPSYSGGRENWLYNIAKEASKNNQRIIIYSLSSFQKSFYNLKGLMNLQVVKIPSIRVFNTVFLVFNKLLLNIPFLLDTFIIFNFLVRGRVQERLNKNDKVIAMNSVIELLPAVALKEKNHGLNLICSIRGQVIRELGEKLSFLKGKIARIEKQLLSKCDKIIVNGFDTQKNIEKVGFSCTVVPNGVDLQKYKNPDKDDNELSLIKKLRKKNKIIIMVASLRKIKGVDDLLFTVPLLKKVYQEPFKILFAGKGYVREYKNKANDIKVFDDVYFLGEKRNISGLLYYSDVVVCLSEGSGLSMSALEAMAANKPIVAWDTPVYKQLFTNRKTGLLVPFKQHRKLAKSLADLLSSGELQQRLGIAARDEVEKYSWKNVYRILSNAINL